MVKMKKMLIILIILSSMFLAGCKTKEKISFCNSIGYDDFNWVNHLPDDIKFFCYEISCNNVITSKVFMNMDDAFSYRNGNCCVKPKSELSCNSS